MKSRKNSSPKFADPCRAQRRRQDANARVAWLSFVALLIGLAIGAFAVYQATKPKTPMAEPGGVALTEGTKSVLARLREPVEVRFYSLFNPDTAPAPAREAAASASELLAAFERQAAGKLTLTRIAEWSTTNTRSAGADGLKPFNIDKGDAVFLGLVVAQGNRKQVLPQVLPEWLPALEFDVARTIERLAGSETAPPPADVERVAAARQAVKKAIANPAGMSLAEGKMILQEKALKEFQSVALEMNQAVAAAERQVEAAKSDSEKQTATGQLQEIRTKFAEKLKEVALRAQMQQEAWERMKSP